MLTDEIGAQRLKLGKVMHASDTAMMISSSKHSNYGDDSASSHRQSCASAINYDSDGSSPYAMSPWHQPTASYDSPGPSAPSLYGDQVPDQGLISSLEREKGHVYSIAASGEFLYTGSDSKNVRVWKDLKEYSGFKSTSGLVKAIVLYGDKIFTGHQDGKVRIWKASMKKPRVYKRIGSLPKFKDMVKKSINPKNYVEAGRRKRNALRIRHFDAISCMSLNEDEGLLYTGSWDKTVKCWRIADSKCLESISAHEDAVNSVVSGFDSVVFTGSADGKVKMWRRQFQGKGTNHFLERVLLDQETAVTALTVNHHSGVVYSGSSDGIVNFWDRDRNFSNCGAMNGHKLAVLCLATTRSLVLSGSADQSICLWSRDAGGSHTCLSVMTGHNGPVKCLAIVDDPNPTGNFDQRWVIYSGSLDRSVKVWRVSEKPHASREEGNEYALRDEGNEYMRYESGFLIEEDQFGRRLQAQ